MKYILTDTFNSSEISRHTTLLNAVKAQRRHLRAVKRANGRDSYLTYSITRSDGQKIEEMEILQIEEQLHYDIA